MVQNIIGTGKIIKDMVVESGFALIAGDMEVNGKRIN